METPKHIWITGGTSGIGLELTKYYLQQGNKVVVTGLEKDAALSLQKNFPDQLFYLAWDVTQLEDVALVTQQLSKYLDTLDEVIICAGICEYVRADQFQPDVFARVMAVNFQGAMNTMAAALPLLRKESSSRVQRPLVTVLSSLSSWVPIKRAGAYGASKAALRYTMHSLHSELDREGIDVSVIQPGFIDTPLMRKLPPLKKYSLMSVEDATPKIIKAIEKRHKEYCFPKALYWQLGFVSMLPMRWQLKIMGDKSRKPKQEPVVEGSVIES